MLSCQRDSRLRELRTQVSRCIPREEGGFHVVLEDTVLYPEGGGQPADHGFIDEIPVLDVQLAKLHALMASDGSDAEPLLDALGERVDDALDLAAWIHLRARSAGSAFEFAYVPWLSGRLQQAAATPAVAGKERQSACRQMVPRPRSCECHAVQVPAACTAATASLKLMVSST